MGFQNFDKLLTHLKSNHKIYILAAAIVALLVTTIINVTVNTEYIPYGEEYNQQTKNFLVDSIRKSDFKDFNTILMYVSRKEVTIDDEFYKTIYDSLDYYAIAFRDLRLSEGCVFLPYDDRGCPAIGYGKRYNGWSDKSFEDLWRSVGVTNKKQMRALSNRATHKSERLAIIAKFKHKLPTREQHTTNSAEHYNKDADWLKENLPKIYNDRAKRYATLNLLYNVGISQSFLKSSLYSHLKKDKCNYTVFLNWKKSFVSAASHKPRRTLEAYMYTCGIDKKSMIHLLKDAIANDIAIKASADCLEY